MKRTVLRMLNEAAALWGSKPYALKKGSTDWIPTSFAQTQQRSWEFAAWILSKGFAKGQSLAILAEGSPEWVVAEHGILGAACVSVPLSIKLLADEIPFRLNHSEARAVLTTKNQLEKVLGSIAALENREILLVYFDDDPGFAREIAARHGISAERVIGFEEALARGRELLAMPDSGMVERLNSIAEATGEDDQSQSATPPARPATRRASS